MEYVFTKYLIGVIIVTAGLILTMPNGLLPPLMIGVFLAQGILFYFLRTPIVSYVCVILETILFVITLYVYRDKKTKSIKE